MIHVMKATSTADLLAMVPQLLGYLPRNSIVFVTFRGARSCGAMRVDLPTSDSPRILRRMVTTMVGMLCKIPDVDAVVTAFFTDEHFGSSAEPPHQAIAAMVERRVQQSGFELRESFCQARDGWASYLDDTTPVGGRDLAELRATRMGDDVPEALRAELGIVDPRAPLLPAADPELVAELAGRIDALERAFADDGDDDSDSDSDDNDGDDNDSDENDSDENDGGPSPMGSAVRFTENVLIESPPPIAATLAFVLQLPAARDRVMLQWATCEAIGHRLWGEGDRESIEEFDDLLSGIGPRPDLDRMVRAIDLLRTVAACLPDARRVPLLCMLGWLNWALGRGSLAARYVEAALAIDPDDGMAKGLIGVLASGLQPDWAFERSSSPVHSLRA